MSTDPLIEAHNIFLKGPNGAILDNIDFTLNTFDFTTIIGPNGAGKTMLLKCLLGLKKPDSGTVKRKDNIRIGYMPQAVTIDPILPISVEYFLCLANHCTKADLEITTQEAGITHLLNHQLNEVSGGELQRILLARALLNNPDLLILDEPAQNLDISGQLDLYKKLEKIYEKRQLTILMVSHDLHLVMSSSKKVICLYHHICCQGAPQAVTRDPEFVTLFGEDMARMMSIYPHHHDHDHTHDIPSD